MQVEEKRITFARLYEIEPKDITDHMSDLRLRDHMPLLTQKWDEVATQSFVQEKEACWQRDGLGHWAILLDGNYIGWGGFQREAEEWDFGLVLKPSFFGLGLPIIRKAMSFARQDERICFVTFLLPLSRTRRKALKRLGAEFVAQVDYHGEVFLKYRLNTPAQP